MKKNAISLSIAVLSLGLAGLAQAQTSTPQQTYKEAAAQCATLSGSAKTNCQRDAYAAHHDSHRNTAAPDQQDMRENRQIRCNKLPVHQRQECVEQMQGQHQTQVYGSVKEGGRLRQTTIEIPGERQTRTHTNTYTPATAQPVPTHTPTSPNIPHTRTVTPIQ